MEYDNVDIGKQRLDKSNFYEIKEQYRKIHLSKLVKIMNKKSSKLLTFYLSWLPPLQTQRGKTPLSYCKQPAINNSLIL